MEKFNDDLASYASSYFGLSHKILQRAIAYYIYLKNNHPKLLSNKVFIVCFYKALEYYGGNDKYSIENWLNTPDADPDLEITRNYILSTYNHFDQDFDEYPDYPDDITIPYDYLENESDMGLATAFMCSEYYFLTQDAKEAATTAKGISQILAYEVCTHLITKQFFDKYAIKFLKSIPGYVSSAVMSNILKAFKNNNCVQYPEHKKYYKRSDILGLANKLMKVLTDNKDADHFTESSQKFCSLLKQGVYKIGKKLGRGVDGTAYILNVADIKEEMVIKRYSMFNSSKHKKEIKTHAIVSSTYHPNISRMYSFFRCSDIYYSIVEKADGTLRQLNKPEIETELIFQILYVLCYLQKRYKFTHYDLHYNNIFYKKVKKENKLYKIEGRTYRVPNYGYLLQIADFGFARLELENGTVIYNYERKYQPMKDLCRLADKNNYLYLAMQGYIGGDENNKKIDMGKNYDCEKPDNYMLEAKTVIPILYHDYIYMIMIESKIMKELQSYTSRHLHIQVLCLDYMSEHRVFVEFTANIVFSLR